MIGCNLLDKIPTLADILVEKGYDTVSFGKLHLQLHLAKKRASGDACTGRYPHIWETCTVVRHRDALFGTDQTKRPFIFGDEMFGINILAASVIYKSGSIIVYYMGRNKEVIKVMEKIMGKQFNGH